MLVSFFYVATASAALIPLSNAIRPKMTARVDVIYCQYSIINEVLTYIVTYNP